MTSQGLPFGSQDLDPAVQVDSLDCNKVRCFVRGCQHLVRRPTRHAEGEACPRHGIYCHYSYGRPTYRFADVRRNIIASPDLFAQRIVNHPFKFDSNRMGAENSEDALTWNVFRSIAEMKQLATVASQLLGETSTQPPRLYLWGIRVDDDSFQPWDLLIAARQQFESNLPVNRPYTEPDIALYLPSQYLVLIEAKFTSPNPVYEQGPRKDSQSLTLAELLNIYWHPALRSLNHPLARTRPRVHYQLWRNMVFAEWMAKADGSGVRPYHLNLVRERSELQSTGEFAELLRPDFRDRFRRVTWESLVASLEAASEHGLHLRQYVRNKTACLRAAFRSHA
jgi:hypothetical protein